MLSFQDLGLKNYMFSKIINLMENGISQKDNPKWILEILKLNKKEKKKFSLGDKSNGKENS